MGLVGKTVRCTYSKFDLQRFIRGTVVEDNKQFLVIEGSKDRARFTIAKTAIIEIVENGGGR